LIRAAASTQPLGIFVMKLHKRAALIGILFALPFVVLASFAWIRGATDKTFPSFEAYFAGDMIYLLGAPATLVALIFPLFGHFFTDRDIWWAIPMMDILFFAQWVFWSQLLAVLSNSGASGRINRASRSFGGDA
jgi:hypothetical protein